MPTIVFLSWSGARSKAMAVALKEWLPMVIQDVEPWMSAADIDAGKRWSEAISGTLQNANFGIFCVTRENMDAPWLNFEAGAISKRVKEANVVPYLLGMKTTDLSGPLGQFQAKLAEKDPTLELVQALNRVCPNAIPLDRLRQIFEKFWDDLGNKLTSIPLPEEKSPPARDISAIVEETLTIVRELARRPETPPRLIVDHKTLAGDPPMSRPRPRVNWVRSWLRDGRDFKADSTEALEMIQHRLLEEGARVANTRDDPFTDKYFQEIGINLARVEKELAERRSVRSPDDTGKVPPT